MVISRIRRVTGRGASSLLLEPSWFTAMADNTIVQVAGGAGFGATYQNGSKLGDVVPTVDDPTAPWVGAAVLRNSAKFTIPIGSGHNDREGRNDTFGIDINTEQPAWSMWNAGSSDRSSGDASSNGAADYADNLPRGCHTSVRVVGTVGGFFIAGMDNFASSSGLNSSAYYYYDKDTDTWTQYAQGFDSTQWADVASWHGGASNYDPTTGYIWIAAQATDLSTRYAIFVVDSGDVTGSGNRGTIIRRFKAYLPWGYHLGEILYDKNPKLWIITHGSTGIGGPYLQAIDITTLASDGSTLTPIDLTFSPPLLGPSGGSERGGMVYHPTSSALFLWDGSGTRSSLNKLSIPSDLTGGTYVGSTVAADGSNTVTPGAAQANGTFGRFNLVTFPSGRQAFVIQNAMTQPIYVRKIPVAGL